MMRLGEVQHQASFLLMELPALQQILHPRYTKESRSPSWYLHTTSATSPSGVFLLPIVSRQFDYYEVTHLNTTLLYIVSSSTVIFLSKYLFIKKGISKIQ